MDELMHNGRRPAKKNLSLTLMVTGTIFLAEIIGGLLTNSLALLADAGHMLVDVSAIIMSLLALQIAARPADPKRTYGYYRFEILAALANGLLLLTFSGILVFEAIERFSTPQQVRSIPMMGVAAIGLAANIVGLWLLSPNKENLNIRGAFLHIIGDTLSSIAVIAGGALMLVTGLFVVDPILSLLIAGVIVVSSFGLIRDSVDILLESVPSHLSMDAITDSMLRIRGVANVHDLHIWSITSGMYAMSAHVVVMAGCIAENDRILTELKESLLRYFHISHTTIQIESEEYEHVAECH